MQRSPTKKQEAWLERYLANGFNASEAAAYVGYRHPEQRGYDNVRKSYIRPLIEARMSELAMSAAETLARISMHARSDDLHVSIRALEMLGKAHGLFSEQMIFSWKRKAEESGIVPSELFEEMVAEYIAKVNSQRAKDRD